MQSLFAKELRMPGLAFLAAAITATLAYGSTVSAEDLPSPSSKSFQKAAGDVKYDCMSFQSNGRPIRTEWYSPSVGPKPTSAVLLIHGSGGIETTGGFFRELSTSLAKNGITAVVVHYMDANSLTDATNAQMAAHFGAWEQTISDAIAFAQKQPGINPKKISLLGHSLGAQLSLHEAAGDARVNSVVDMAGCFVPGGKPTAEKVTRMPKVLILQGSADKVVTMPREQKLVATLKKIGSPYQEHIFPNSDHMLSNTDPELTNLIIAFLK